MSRARDLAAFVSNADGDIKFDTDTLFIDSSANSVGIGTSSPTAKLHLASDGPQLMFEDTAGGNHEDYSIVANAGLFKFRNETTDEDIQILSDTEQKFLTNNTERMRVDSNGNVGIGTTNPQYGRLHIADGNSDIAMDANGSGQLHIDGNAYGFGIALNGDGAQIYTTSITRDIIFGTNETERVRISNDGLSFNGDTAADNALYDYEEGTWTPVFSNSFLEGAFANATGFTGASGRYVKVGNLVTCWAEMTKVTGETGTLTGDDNFCFTTASLPYTPSSTTNFRHLGGEVWVYGAVGTGNNASGTIIALQNQSVIVAQITAITTAGSLDATAAIGMQFSFRTIS